MNNSNENPLFEVSASFKHDVIKEVLKTNFANPKNKITDEAVALTSELAKLMVIEAALRSAKQASQENRKSILLDHIEVILPQLILDFP